MDNFGPELPHGAREAGAREPAATLHDLHTRVEVVADRGAARAAVIAPQRQHHLVALRCAGVAHLGGGAFGAGKAAREERVQDAHGAYSAFALVAQDLPRCVASRHTGHATAWVRARSTKIKPLERRAIVAVAERGSGRP